MENFEWQLIKFRNGSNPYICKTAEEFKKIGSKYRLVALGKSVWLAEDENEERIREQLREQGLWEREIDEVLHAFGEIGADNLEILYIYDTLWDLGEHYIETLPHPIDRHIDAVLDYEELGTRLVNECELYYFFETTGRIIEFD